MNSLVLILFSVFMSGTGQLMFKLGADKLGSIFCSWQAFLHDLIRILSTPQVWFAFSLYAVGFFTWMKALTREDLSYVYPMAGLSYVLVVFYSYFFFKEPLTINKVLGIVLIISGVVAINR